MAEPIRTLITGCSSGFGYLTAKTLAARGHTVFAAMRDTEGRNRDIARELEEWAEFGDSDLTVLDMDVANEISVNRAVAEAIDRTGKIDVLINNAGLYKAEPIEATSLEMMEELFEVNVFGVQRVNRAVLPIMRREKHGLIIHVSSGAGRLVLPFHGLYAASKHALEALAECYHYELKPLGIESIILQPGAYPTGLTDKNPDPSDPERAKAYGSLQPAQMKMLGWFTERLKGDKAGDPQDIADEIVRLIDLPHGKRPLRTRVDPSTGDSVETINACTDKVQRDLLSGMGLDSLL